jgi:hypothetical protein
MFADDDKMLELQAIVTGLLFLGAEEVYSQLQSIKTVFVSAPKSLHYDTLDSAL